MKSFAKALLINGLLLLVLVVVADFVTGLLVAPPEAEDPNAKLRSVALREWPPLMDIEMTPSDGRMRGVEGLEQRPYRLRTDQSGFIVGPDQSQQTGRPDIVFFGGSTTECMYVDEALRFPYLVGEALTHSSSNEPVVSLNAGVSGNHSMHSAINLLAKAVPREPRIVVLMNNVNDLSLLGKTGSYWIAPESRVIVRDPARVQQQFDEQQDRLAMARSPVRSAIYWLAPNIYELLRTRFNPVATVDEWDGFRFDAAGFELDAIAEKYRESLQSFVSLARASDIDVVVNDAIQSYSSE